MRSSVDRSDPGFANFLRHGGFKRKWHIFVDGRIIPRVVTADEEQGYVEIYKQDQDGQYVLDGDQIKRERIYGHVKILHDEQL